jgi:ketosteroid isomerase-like protein
MDEIRQQIEEIIDRETRAWNTQDVKLLMTVWHPDMVFIWPPDADAHDPVDWVMGMGRYHYQRWSRAWQEIFDTHDLVRNNRVIRKIKVSDEGDGAFAVVDIDTLWRHKETGEDFLWKGRVCKVYTKMPDGWKCIMHTGALNFD